MKIICRICTFVFLVSCATAWAGEKGGNGGDVIICSDKIELLDSYEARERGMVIRLDGSTVDEKVRNIISRVAKFDYFVAKRLNAFSEEILKDLTRYRESLDTKLENIFFTDNSLRDVDDSLELMIPAGCRKEQLVIQRVAKTEFDIQQRYIIRKALWDMLDVNNQALTVLHESWLRASVEKGAEDSRFARLMNEYTSSTLMDEVDRDAYAGMYKYSSSLNGGLKYGVIINGYIRKDYSNELIKHEYHYSYDVNSILYTEDGFSYLLEKQPYEDLDTGNTYVSTNPQIFKKMGSGFRRGKVHKTHFYNDGTLKRIEYLPQEYTKITCINGEIGSSIHTENYNISELPDGTVVLESAKGFTVIKDNMKYKKVKSVSLDNAGFITKIEN